MAVSNCQFRVKCNVETGRGMLHTLQEEQAGPLPPPPALGRLGGRTWETGKPTKQQSHREEIMQGESRAEGQRRAPAEEQDGTYSSHLSRVPLATVL